MTVTVELATSPELVQRLAHVTSRREGSNYPLTPEYFGRMLEAGHSPVRGLLLLVTIRNIPSEVSVHFVRHKIGVEHFVSTSRPDRTGQPRGSLPVNHCMLLNAEALVNIAHKRLCNKAEATTRAVMQEIVTQCTASTNPFVVELARHLVPECVYRGSCHELRPCGLKGAV